MAVTNPWIKCARNFAFMIPSPSQKTQYFINKIKKTHQQQHLLVLQKCLQLPQGFRDTVYPQRTKAGMYTGSKSYSILSDRREHLYQTQVRWVSYTAPHCYFDRSVLFSSNCVAEHANMAENTSLEHHYNSVMK